VDLEKAQLPLLLKEFSWTRAAPYKEERFHRLVSDSIGNNFTPTAANLNMSLLSKRTSASGGNFHVI
jgi:dynein heavy chain